MAFLGPSWWCCNQRSFSCHWWVQYDWGKQDCRPHFTVYTLPRISFPMVSRHTKQCFLLLGYEGSEVTLFNGWMQSCWWFWYHVGEWLYFASLLLAYFSILFWKLNVLEEKVARLNLYCLSVCLPTPENISSGSLVLRTNTLDYYTLTTYNYKGVSLFFWTGNTAGEAPL